MTYAVPRIDPGTDSCGMSVEFEPRLALRDEVIYRSVQRLEQV